jgi:hypothetical protein
MRVLIFSVFLSEKFLILRRLEEIWSQTYSGRRVKYPSYINETWIFSADFRKTLKYKIPRKSLRWKPSCSMRTDGQTDMTELIFAFHNFADESKNEVTLYRQPLKET